MSHVKNIDAQQLKAWLDSGEAILVDVREPGEFTEWRIPQAMSMPLTNIEAHLPHLEGEKRKIVFQCLKGKRGEMGAEAAMKKFADADIYNLTGDIEAWDAAGMTITRDANQPSGLPIVRQAHITVGALVCFFSLLALFGVKFGAVMSLLTGGGLLLAGLTGTCAVSILLKQCPWNK